MSAAFLPHQPEIDDDVIDATVVSTPRIPSPNYVHKVATKQVSSEPKRSILEQFVDGFFRRENIRWLAVIGAAIVVASSLMMVTREWAEWPVIAKFLTILGYTGLTYLFSEFGRKHLGLQITARVLQFLTLLLLPITFLSLSWLFGPEAAFAGSVTLQMAVLLVPAIALAWFSASQIFEHLWRGKQITFLVSYLLLSVAGALPRMTDAWSAAGLTFALWFITSIGAIKINRHVFWITEEHRLPRAFGFLPIVLLGTQFVVLVAIKTALTLPIEWMGLVLVMMAGTVLMTTRAVADVHRQRTGGNLRPLPWNILAPLIIGVGMALFGVAVSFHGFSYGLQTTYAIVPSTLLAGLLMMQVTRETNQRAFVWIGLVLLTIAYQCAPTLVSGFVQQVKSSAASAVGEDRLPIAFYGLSYLPLLLTVSISSAVLARRRHETFAVPMRHFATFLAIVLFGLSWMHLKAIFPVATVSCCLFGLYAVLFQDRRYILASMLALTVATGAWIPFVNAMQIANIHYFHIVTSLSVLSLGLASIPAVDRVINRLPQPSQEWQRDLANVFGEPPAFARCWSTALALTLSACWVAWAGRNMLIHWADLVMGPGTMFSFFEAINTIGYLPLLALVANFAVLTNRTRSPYYSFAMWGLIVVSSVAMAFLSGASLLTIATGATVALATTQLLTTVVLRKRLESNSLNAYAAMLSDTSNDLAFTSLRVAFLFPLHAISTGLLAAIVSVAIIPSLIATNLMLPAQTMTVAAIAVLAWLIALKVGLRYRIAGIVAAVAFPLVCSATLISVNAFPITFSTLPLIWTVSAVIVSVAAYRSEPRELISIQRVSFVWVLACAVLSLTSFDITARLTALVALGSLAITERSRLQKKGWTTLAIAVNVQLLMLVVGLSGLSSWTQIPLHPLYALAVLPNVIAALAISTVVWDLRRLRMDEEIRIAFASVLRAAFVFSAVLTFAIQTLSPLQLAVAIAAFAIAAAVEFAEGVRKQHVAHVWSMFTVIVCALAWLIVHQQLVIGSGVSQIAFMMISVCGLIGAKLIRDHHRLGFAAQPLEQLGLVCPAIVVGMTMFRTAFGMPALLPGVDSAMLLTSAAIYFYRGLATSNRGLLIASACIFNVSSAHLWISLSLNDLQLYLVPLGLTIIGLVELLKKEIPVASHNTIRNIGSLAILVSPAFEIIGGSWLHMITLMLLCILVILLAIGLRIRNLVYIGTAFLLADLTATVVQSAIANPGMLWIGGLATGVAVIALAAYCENHREQLLSRIRMLSAELATWN